MTKIHQSTFSSILFQSSHQSTNSQCSQVRRGGEHDKVNGVILQLLGSRYTEVLMFSLNLLKRTLWLSLNLF